MRGRRSSSPDDEDTGEGWRAEVAGEGEGEGARAGWFGRMGRRGERRERVRILRGC